MILLTLIFIVYTQTFFGRKKAHECDSNATEHIKQKIPKPTTLLLTV